MFKAFVIIVHTVGVVATVFSANWIALTWVLSSACWAFNSLSREQTQHININ
jgi:hypothetical protein